MRKLYFVRHGQSKDNQQGVWSRYDTPLTAQGKDEARAAGKNIKQKDLIFDLIIASPQPRALQTARIIAQEIGHPIDTIELNELFIERNWGRLTGIPGKDFYNQGKIYKDIDLVEGAETIQALQARATRGLAYLHSRPEIQILLVSHGTYGRALRRTIQGEPYTNEYQAATPTGRINNAEVVVLI
jgi:broad specificity phosphatase PhoE